MHPSSMHPSKNIFMVDGVWSVSLLGKHVEGDIARKRGMGMRGDVVLSLVDARAVLFG